MSEDLARRVGQYVALRDKIAEVKKRHEAELAPYSEALEKLGNVLLGVLQTNNVDSMATPGGTFYRNTVVSVTVNDPAEFRKYVVDNGSWNLADVRANKVGVAAFVSMEKKLPPGVKLEQILKVGVRRPNGGNSDE